MQTYRTLKESYETGFTSVDVPAGFAMKDAWARLTETVKTRYANQERKGYPDSATIAKTNGTLQLTANVFVKDGTTEVSLPLR